MLQSGIGTIVETGESIELTNLRVYAIDEEAQKAYLLPSMVNA